MPGKYCLYQLEKMKIDLEKFAEDLKRTGARTEFKDANVTTTIRS
jgi:hypothetical protein